jgi:hypothetical protein
VISPDGAVAKVIPHVKPDTHADDVLGALAAASAREIPRPRASPCPSPEEGCSCDMQLFLRDPKYTDRLAAFLTSVGRHAVVTAPDRVDIDEHDDDLQRLEVEMYLRVWAVIHPDADVELAAG